MTRIAIIYYSATGTTHALAKALSEGAQEADADVRFRRVAELAPDEAISANAAWREHHDTVSSHVPEATLDDLEWADGVALGSPTRYGLIAAQLKQFVDTTGPLWAEGVLVDKVATAFTIAQTAHGGHDRVVVRRLHPLGHGHRLARVLEPGTVRNRDAVRRDLDLWSGARTG